MTESCCNSAAWPEEIKMQFSDLNDQEWLLFLDWAAAEGWQVPFQEQRLFQTQWRPYFFVLRTEGKAQGFVSAVAYKESGWIGNLLVDPEQRGRGFGAALFDYALRFLRQSKLKRIWLTASEAGQPIYQRRGFVDIDRIDRWVADGTGRQFLREEASIADLITLDSHCWGESRAPLLALLADDGHVYRSGQSIGLLQTGIGSWQFGPWLSTEKSPEENRHLLEQVLTKTVTGKELLIDALASAEQELLLRSSGFCKRGSNRLMVLSHDTVSLNGVIALASLGSVG